MRRENQFNDVTCPYHMTARTVNAEPFSCSLEMAWKIFCEELYLSSIFYKIKIHAFVLMPNHFHLLVSNPEGLWAEFSRYFMRQVSVRINFASGRMNQNFGGPHFRCAIGSYQYYLHAYKYIYLNPVRKKLCQSPIDYPFSSLQYFLRGELPFPIYDDLLIDDTKGTLDWLNRIPNESHMQVLKKALLKKKFKLPTGPSRKRHDLEFDAL